nr:MAG TPA: hypothetical protein [Caudoviricetes sp.]
MNIAGLFGFLNNIFNVAAQNAGRLEQLIDIGRRVSLRVPIFERPQGDSRRAGKRRPAVALLLPHLLEPGLIRH